METIHPSKLPTRLTWAIVEDGRITADYYVLQDALDCHPDAAFSLTFVEWADVTDDDDEYIIDADEHRYIMADIARKDGR